MAQRFTKGSTNAHVKKLRNGIGAWIHQSNRKMCVPSSVRPMKDVNTKRTESKPAARNTVRIGMGELPMYDAKHTWWLNPEHPRSWNTGDSAAREYSAVVPMVECRNLRQLTEFIHDIC